VERCAEAQSKQCFANFVVPDFFLFYQGVQSVFPPFPWFSAGFILVFSTAGDGTRADRLRRQLLHPRGARVA